MDAWGDYFSGYCVPSPNYSFKNLTFKTCGIVPIILCEFESGTLYQKIGVYLNLDQLSYESFNSSPCFFNVYTHFISMSGLGDLVYQIVQ